MTLDQDQDAFAWRTRQAFDIAHEDLDAAIDRRDLSGLVRAAYVLGRIAEQLDGRPSNDDVVEQWNEAVRRFNGASRNHQSSFQLGEMNPRQVLTQRADNPASKKVSPTGLVAVRAAGFGLGERSYEVHTGRKLALIFRDPDNGR